MKQCLLRFYVLEAPRWVFLIFSFFKPLCCENWKGKMKDEGLWTHIESLLRHLRSQHPNLHHMDKTWKRFLTGSIFYKKRVSNAAYTVITSFYFGMDWWQLLIRSPCQIDSFKRNIKKMDLAEVIDDNYGPDCILCSL